MSEQQDLLPDALPPVRWVTLDDVPVPVTPHYAGLVFSTRPRIAGASDGFDYFIKGPEIEVVVAEAVGYELAARAGLDVPEWALCRASHDEDVFFASRAMRVRSGVDQLIARKLHVNGDFLGNCIAFDAWTSNRDRNANNVVAEPVGGKKGSEVRLVAIDFEKADILRGLDRFTVTAHAPRAFRPTGDLAVHCALLPFPAGTCQRIAAISKDDITAIFHRVERALPRPIPWRDSAADFLASRGRRIVQLTQEVWNV